MTRSAALSLALAAVIAAGTAVEAAASERGDRRQAFREMDTNNDGALQFAEIEAMRATVFQRADANGDEVLEIEEFRAMVTEHASARRGGRTPDAERVTRRFERFDTDADGKLTRAEFVETIPRRLAAADRNGDETLTRDELRQMRRDRGGDR